MVKSTNSVEGRAFLRADLMMTSETISELFGFTTSIFMTFTPFREAAHKKIFRARIFSSEN